MQFDMRNTGLIRECFDDHTPNMKALDIKKATLATGDMYLTEYAAAMKNKGDLDERTLKTHLEKVYNTFMEDGHCTKNAWNMVLKVLYPINDDRRIISEMIDRHADLLPDVTLTVASESASAATGEITDKSVIYGHLVQKTCEAISTRYGKLLQIKI